ncbi:DUF222 domain-containing protein [Spongisporangium articulatum]|uniref:DUF222 domain-containing protein n=1 Tax=Spongisporangium articulatum TaxID=3362603 RepID=A0ABW8ATQ4_9ACTN
MPLADVEDPNVVALLRALDLPENLMISFDSADLPEPEPVPDFVTVEQLQGFVGWLTGSVLPSDDAERLAVLGQLEQVSAAVAAVQARVMAGYDASVRDRRRAAGQPDREARRAVNARVAEALHVSPHKASRLVGVARCLVDELPHTLAALEQGRTSQWRATLVVRETALLSRESRADLDEELAHRIEGLGDAGVEREARRIGQRLEPGLAYKRAKNAEVGRRVTIRPAPDCMTVVTATLPVAEGVAVYAALARVADSATADARDERGRGQVMADTLVARVLGTETPESIPVEVQLVISDRALTGVTDEPAHVHGYGPIPAPLARALADPPDQHVARQVRRLWGRPETGELVQMEGRSRTFPPGLRRFIVARDQYCRTPWCDAPIRQIDHVHPHARGGSTSAVNGQGLCQACNLAKEALQLVS